MASVVSGAFYTKDLIQDSLYFYLPLDRYTGIPN